MVVNLAGFLGELRRAYQRTSDLPGQILYSYLYPLVLTLFISGGMWINHLFLWPQLEQIYIQMGNGEGPSVWWSRLLIANEVVAVAAGFILLTALLGGFSPRFRTSWFRLLDRVIDQVALWIPLAGGVIREESIRSFASGAGLLLRAGATLPEAVRAAAEAERNGVLRRRYEKLAARLEEGVGFSEGLRRQGGFPDALLWFAETGEATGTLPEHLLQAAAYHDTRMHWIRQLASRLTVPCFVFLNGVLVLGTFLLMFLPYLEYLKLVTPE